MDRREFLAAAAAPLVLGVVPVAFARSSGGTPLALVTADLESHVVAVDVSSGRVHRRLRTPADPRSIESIGAIGALVAHTAAGRMTLIDSDLRVRPITGRFGAPRYTAVSPDRRFAYVTDSAREELVVVDVHGRRVVGRVDVGGPCRHLAIDRNATRLWVALGNKAESVAVLSLAEARRPRVVGTIRPPFLAHDVGFTPGGRRVWVTSGDRGRIAIYDARSGKLLRTLAGDAPPQHVTFLGDRAFVTSGDDAVLRVHALDGRLLRSAAVPVGSYNVQQGQRWILTPSLSQGTLCTFTARGAPLARGAHRALLTRCVLHRRHVRDLVLRTGRRVSGWAPAATSAPSCARRSGDPPRGSRRSFACTGPGHTVPRSLSSTTPPRPRTSPRKPFWPRCATSTASTAAGPSVPGCTGSSSTGRSTGRGRASYAAEAELHESLPAPDATPPIDESVLGALAALPAEHRAVIVLRHLLEYTPGEIAELLGLPRGTVNSRLRRGLDSLEEQV